MSVDLSGADWFKSSRSGAGKECVEVAFLPAGRIGVRDSKNPQGPALVFDAAQWRSFTAGLENGVFDL
ncbi:DUF397 domain-containing protein [Nocardia aurantiaca]|uniref:DUF397 domain-containing protein n=1 Tax=Nocardia aurantiaca TaxID=2675850 RepID=A0A6I3L1Y6_9NOCA|nr:DUF397 domain-containing protein [Nocardia aurantiaca]MTE14635.1 DUF397 domain-containing protein [Nocardia aurantiaca]